MALTTSKLFFTLLGDKTFLCYEITGDASETTWTAPVAIIDAAWAQEITAGVTAGYQSGVYISHATNVVTFGTAPAAASKFNVFVVGTA